jgi:hypothetical protein
MYLKNLFKKKEFLYYTGGPLCTYSQWDGGEKKFFIGFGSSFQWRTRKGAQMCKYTLFLFKKKNVLSVFKNCLKRQSHEIFDLQFFHKSMAPRALINTLKYFRILLRIRGASRLWSVENFNSALCCIAWSLTFFIS